MGNYDIGFFDPASPNPEYNELGAKKKFFRGSETTFDQPAPYTALDAFEPAMSEEEQVMMNRAPHDFLPDQRHRFQPNVNPLPINTSSIRRLDRFRSGFRYRSEFSGLDGVASEARSAAKKASGVKAKVLNKLAEWSDLIDTYQDSVEKRAASVSNAYSKGYLLCTTAQDYNRSAIAGWSSMSNMLRSLRNVSPQVAATLPTEIPSPMLFAHSLKTTYASGALTLQGILPEIQCGAEGLVAPGAAFHTAPNSKTMENSCGLGGWFLLAGVLLGGLVTALVFKEFGEAIWQPMWNSLDGTAKNKLELELARENNKTASKRAEWVEACIKREGKLVFGMTAKQRADVSKSCNDQAAKIFKDRALTSNMGLFEKLILGGVVLTAGYFGIKWWRNRRQNG